MPTVLALDLTVTQAVPAAAPDRTGLIVLGLLVGAAVVAMWRPLLRLLLIALVALVVIGLGVVMSPALPSASTTPGTTQEPGPSSTAPAPTDTQRAQTG